MYTFVSVWQSIGWGAIIYLSAITGIDEEMYEAARIDGCSRFKMMYKITLPSIRSTIVIMLILKIGGMMSIGFEQPQMLKNSMVNDVADVILSLRPGERQVLDEHRCRPDPVDHQFRTGNIGQYYKQSNIR